MRAIEEQSEPATVPRDDSESLVQQWEAHYRDPARLPLNDDWWTISSWKKHLFGPILPSLAGKFVVDVGCGTAARIARIAPIETYKYRYLGIDASVDALQRAARNLPGATFVRADLASFELKSNVADVVFCLGVLMYFADNTQVLARLLNILKPGGFLLLHEQVRRKSWGDVARRLLSVGRDIYPPAYGVRPKELSDYLAQRGTIVRHHLAGSPFRTLFIRMLDDSPLRFTRPLAALGDSCWCATAGRLLPAVGPAEIQILFQKQR